jgi:hypothetical protein
MMMTTLGPAFSAANAGVSNSIVSEANVEILSFILLFLTFVPHRSLNGRVDRIVLTIKYEGLHKFILFGQRHLDHIVREWVDYYNKTRSHVERDGLPPIRETPEEVPMLNRDKIVVRSYVGGLVKSSERKEPDDPHHFLLSTFQAQPSIVAPGRFDDPLVIGLPV